MESYSRAAMERAMKVQEVILWAAAKQISWWQAAEIIGISDRQMRRWRSRYEEFGFRGLFDRRRGKPSPKRVPLGVVERVLGALSGEVFRSQPAPRKATGRAPDRAQLQLGERGAHCLGRYSADGVPLPGKARTALSRESGTAPFPCNPTPKINPTPSARAQL
jgi:Helix-turn-helix domain